jgi:signal transduction histidine kinase
MQQSSALAMAPPLSQALPAPAKPTLAVATRVSGRDLHVVLDAFRGVLALIAMLLVLEVRSDHQAALELATRVYAVYAAILLLLRFQGVRMLQHAAVHWLDAVWCLLLFGLASGGNGFFVLLFFPVLLAAVRFGLLQSVAMATTCAAVAAVILSTHAAETHWLRIVAVPAALLVLGPMAALLVHAQTQVQHGYSFGSELVNALDARRGVEAIGRRALELTAARFGCDRGLLALQTRDGSARVFQYGPDQRVNELTAAAVRAVSAELLAASSEQNIGFAWASDWLRRSHCSAFDLHTGAGMRMPADVPAFAALANRLERENVVLLPAGQRGSTGVWLLLGRDRHPFRREQVATLHHVIEQIVPVLDNAMLLEQLVAATAETERARIGRDLHDSALQPYVGLKFAIEALARQIPAGTPLARHAGSLVTMANEELHSLREIVSGLRGAGGSGDALFEQAVRRQAARFAALFDMHIEVTTGGDLPVSRRLSGELFHMVSEGLANVRRHTRARRASVSLVGGRELTLTISNEVVPGEPQPTTFEPRSLSERAAELGGTAAVHIDSGGTTVRVSIPWQQEAPA